MYGYGCGMESESNSFSFPVQVLEFGTLSTILQNEKTVASMNNLKTLSGC